MSKKKKKHVHSGRSSRGILDAAKILEQAGLNKGATVLDIGCGDGYFSVAASRIVGSAGKVYALDSFRQSLSALKKEIADKDILNIEPTLADATEEIPIPDESIDFSLMVNVLHGFIANEEMKSTMKEVTRVLKTGGTLAIVDFKKKRSLHGPPFSIRLNPEEVDGAIAPYSFDKQIAVETGPFHYLVTFVKTKQQ